jgi:DNA-binding response OmpR family regulator
MPEEEKRRVLVVDDETAICAVCERVLTNNGFEVDIVNDGETAEKSVKEQIYDLLLVDIRLPKESGMEFYIWLKQEYQEISQRVVFMTGSVMGSDVANFLKQSARPYLFKPFRPDELTKTVEEFFKNFEQ